jgi:hypothetical protein
MVASNEEEKEAKKLFDDELINKQIMGVCICKCDIFFYIVVSVCSLLLNLGLLEQDIRFILLNIYICVCVQFLKCSLLIYVLSFLTYVNIF